MDYFVEGTLNDQNTVIEQAAIRRLTIFAELGRSAQLVLLEYSPYWTHTVEKNQRSAVASMFDHFQIAGKASGHPIMLTQLDKRLGYYDYVSESVHHRLIYSDGDITVAHADRDDQGRVQTVTYFGYAGQRLEVDQYDPRGFLSRQRFYYGGHVTHEEYLDPDGATRITITYDTTGAVNMVWLPSEGLMFPGLTAFQRYYCTTVLKPAALIVVDRREYDWLAATWPTAHAFLRIYNQLPSEPVDQAQLILRQRQQAEGGTLLDEYAEPPEQIKAAWRSLFRSL